MTRWTCNSTIDIPHSPSGFLCAASLPACGGKGTLHQSFSHPGFRRFAPTSLPRSPRGPAKHRMQLSALGPTGCFRLPPSSKQAWLPPESKNSRSLARPAAFLFAVSEGFEPPVRSHVHLFSRQAPSTTRTTHLWFGDANIRFFSIVTKRMVYLSRVQQTVLLTPSREPLIFNLSGEENHASNGALMPRRGS